MQTLSIRRRTIGFAFSLITLLVLTAAAQSGRDVYDQVKAFTLKGGKADVTSLKVVRDRVEMTFSGTFYFSSPVEGKVTGAVFVGQGNFHALVPTSEFERSNVKRLLGVEDQIDSDFKTAVLRFSDDGVDLLTPPRTPGDAPAQAQELALDTDRRILKQTSANIPARVALSIINRELPGFFFASFAGGKRGTFSYILDPQKRVPTATFGLNGGERGVLFSYKNETLNNDIWMAFYSLSDYQRKVVTYSDYSDLVHVSNYDMDIDLTDPSKRLGLKTRMTMQPLTERIRAIPFTLGEDLGEEYDVRLKKQMHVKSVHLGAVSLDFAQEDWEGGVTVFLPEDADPSHPMVLEMELSGDFLTQPETPTLSDNSYPASNESWYPRHGYLSRATYDFTFRSKKGLKVACVGTRTSEAPAADDKATTITHYVMTQPVGFVAFALGPFTRHTQTVKWDNSTDKPIELEFNSLDFLAINEDLMMAELNNSVRFFHEMFGRYPFDSFAGTYHPFQFGQGLPSMVMVPATNQDDNSTFSFLAHETSHQWWGHAVAWRSYRDQWLSEGFAEYSGVLYTNFRKNPHEGKKLIDAMRASLLQQLPWTKGRLVDVGPLIMGHRVSTRKTNGAYQALVYNKGALVLRMIHFLLTDPNGDGKPFFDMMKDFVQTYYGKTASSDDFRRIANKHFAESSIAQRYNLTDLDWFFQQFVNQTALPSYSLEYKIEDQPDKSVIISGEVTQTGAGESWIMPLPVEFKFAGKKTATGIVVANGTKAPFRLKLPMRPEKIELDPYHWVLSEKTETK